MKKKIIRPTARENIAITKAALSDPTHFHSPTKIGMKLNTEQFGGEEDHQAAAPKSKSH